MLRFLLVNNKPCPIFQIISLRQTLKRGTSPSKENGHFYAFDTNYKGLYQFTRSPKDIIVTSLPLFLNTLKKKRHIIWLLAVPTPCNWIFFFFRTFGRWGHVYMPRNPINVTAFINCYQLQIATPDSYLQPNKPKGPWFIAKALYRSHLKVEGTVAVAELGS